MDYYIINEIAVDGTGHMINVYGYTTSVDDANSINDHYDECLGAWIITNGDALSNGTIHVANFFDTNPTCYSAKESVTDISIYGEITEITDITNLI
jgi:hypothetical protein